MAKIEKFRYNGTDREVVVLEEDEVSIRGIDLTKFDEKERKTLRETLGKVDPEKWAKNEKGVAVDQKAADKELAIIKPAMINFRHFKKSHIEKPKTNE
jgi:hypothetical protein